MRGSRALSAVMLAAVLAACTTHHDPAPAAPPPPPSSSTATPAPPRDFTVATTERVATFDPAAARTDADDIVAYNVFQRLMTASPGDATLHPDAASDCLYESPVIYRCTLRDGLTFNNGDPLTSADVKFSILRAYRLGTATAARALANLDHIDTPGPLTVQFFLKRSDNQFGYALTSPSASIVDSKIYDSDAVRPQNMSAVGSGPYQLTNVAVNGLLFTAHRKYAGFTPPGIERILVSYFKDSAAVEDAMTKKQVDVAWNALSAAANRRLLAQIKTNASTGATDTGFQAVTQPGSRLVQLAWNASSTARQNADLRGVVALALQGDRTLDSLIPPGQEAHTASFPSGGTASIPPLPGSRPRLTMGYDSTAPDAADLANRFRDRLEGAGVSVQLLPDSGEADLLLGESDAWCQAPVAYLTSYLGNPLPGSAQKLADLDQRYRGVTDHDSQLAALSEIQKQAAADLIVLPIEQDDNVVFLTRGVSLMDPKFGPGWQLALWSMRK